MTGKNASLYLFALLIIVITGQLIHYYPLLPQQVASHFDINGRPDSYASRGSFLVFSLTLLAVISGIFFISAFFIRKVPPMLLNLPNKDFWLSDERKENTYAVFSSFAFWFADITLIFIFYIIRNVIEVNLGKKTSLGDSFFYVLISYVFAAGVVGALFIKRFMRIDDSGQPAK